MCTPKEFSSEELHLIAKEFRRSEGKYYLDHAGATLYSEKQIDVAGELLKTNLLSNPHTSKVTEDLIDQVRYKVLTHFGTDINDYSIVFTSGTTAALKLVAECFDFGSTGSFTYVQENHTSVLGMRDVVSAENIYVLTREEFLKNLEISGEGCQIIETSGNSLVTFSAQCNFSGFKYPLELVQKIQQNGLASSGLCLRGDKIISKTKEYYICLDAASFVATNFLDLNTYNPDFVCISFYKIFGYPTGLGALLVSKRGQNLLKKKYFGGGTVKIAMSAVDFHEKRDCFHEKFEDGTIPFLSIVSLLSGFSTIERLVPTVEKSTMQRISNHVFEVAKYCYESLKDLTYENGQPLVKFYTHTKFDSNLKQGGIVTFNLLQENGEFIGFAEVACLASIYDITLRTGCFCNPGACQILLELKNEELMRHYKAGHICGDYNDLVDGVPTGAVRVSFGYMSRAEDVNRLIYMLTDCYLKGSHRKLQILQKMQVPHPLQGIQARLTGNSMRLREICIFPIKSCGAFKIRNNWELTENGLKYDRCWMITNSNGVAFTQKTNTRLCLIQPIIDLEKKTLVLTYPGTESISILLDPNGSNKLSSTLCQSKVCADLVEGFDCGGLVASWLQNCLGVAGLRLIQQGYEHERKTRNGTVKNINLANQAQFLLINRTSVKWLASKVDEWHDVNYDLDSVVERFRANLIVETVEPLVENDIKEINIGGISFAFEGPCTRCQMICIDQRTGLKTAEPLKTVAREFGGKVRFGVYLSQMHRNINKNKFISCKDNISVYK